MTLKRLKDRGKVIRLAAIAPGESGRWKLSPPQALLPAEMGHLDGRYEAIRQAVDEMRKAIDKLSAEVTR